MLEVIGIILLVLGFVLVGFEMIAPGFGLPGISGIVCLVVGVILTAKTVSAGIIMAIVIIVILGIMLAVIMTLLSSKKIKTPIVLREEVKGEQGFLNSADLEYLVGKEGVAVTDLRPSGKGSFEGVVFDVLSEGNYIKREQPIRIIRVKNMKLVVSEKE